MSSEFESFVRALPKVELHVHLLGSASPQTVVELAARYPDSPVPADVDLLHELYVFRDFAHFIDVYKSVASLVRDGDDIRALTVGLARDLSRHAVRYAEVMVSPYLHAVLGLPVEELLAGLSEGRRQALSVHNVRLGWIFDIPGEYGVGAGEQTMDIIRRLQPADLVGLSLAGIEEGVDRRDFAAVFGEARAMGLHSVPHAGETTGPATIWAAIRDLKAERIGHGTSCMEDEQLTDYLAEHGIPVEVCLTSNVRTRAVPDLAAHPMPAMLDAGIVVTINTDDPPMFDADLTGEYLHAARLAGLGRERVSALAVNAVRASFLDSATKRALISEIDAHTIRP